MPIKVQHGYIGMLKRVQTKGTSSSCGTSSSNLSSWKFRRRFEITANASMPARKAYQVWLSWQQFSHSHNSVAYCLGIYDIPQAAPPVKICTHHHAVFPDRHFVCQRLIEGRRAQLETLLT